MGATGLVKNKTIIGLKYKTSSIVTDVLLKLKIRL